jgi:nucleotide-binding universal stress UspA family protein
MSRGPIVVGYDDKPPAWLALERAITVAKSSGAELVVVAVEEMTFDPEGPQSFGAVDSPPEMIPLVAPADVEAVLERARERVADSGVAADFVWAAGEPAAGIVGVARERHASLVVLGSHHHGVMGRLFGADVAAEVKRELGADLVIVD